MVAEVIQRALAGFTCDPGRSPSKGLFSSKPHERVRDVYAVRCRVVTTIGCCGHVVAYGFSTGIWSSGFRDLGPVARGSTSFVTAL